VPVEIQPNEAVRRSELARDVARDLTARPKRLQSRYLYDALGSQLFEAICELPWYQITRAEQRLLAAHASEIVSALQGNGLVIELGGGSGQKLSRILEEAARHSFALDVHLVDVSAAALEQSLRTLSAIDGVVVTPHLVTYDEGLRQAVVGRRPAQPVLVLFLGSNIGNLGPDQTRVFLRDLRSSLNASDLFLLGADLTKPAEDLLLAYDDPLGVTAAFNKNLLVRLNRELEASFDLRRFEHRAVWNHQACRVECHLVSLDDHRVVIPAADLTVHFERDETIWTESSYKYEPDGLIGLGEETGFRCRRQWIDQPARFALTLFDAV
jgi:dimethylhistidine N-methyltransferase